MVYKIPPMKHVIQNFQGPLNISAQTVVTLAVGVENPDPYTNVTNVRNGSIIRQIILQLDWMDSNANANFTDALDWYVWFNINGAQTRPLTTNTNSSHLKNQIFHQDGAIIGVQGSTSVGFGYPQCRSWRVVINIPRGYQQINLGDVIEFVFQGQQATASAFYKLTAIYKEIFP